MKPRVAPVIKISPPHIPSRELPINETRFTGPGDNDAARANSDMETMREKVIKQSLK
jgi:hypothetical protein